jgi:hypothetical protein
MSSADWDWLIAAVLAVFIGLVILIARRHPKVPPQ